MESDTEVACLMYGSILAVTVLHRDKVGPSGNSNVEINVHTNTYGVIQWHHIMCTSSDTLLGNLLNL